MSISGLEKYDVTHLTAKGTLKTRENGCIRLIGPQKHINRLSSAALPHDTVLIKLTSRLKQ